MQVGFIICISCLLNIEPLVNDLREGRKYEIDMLPNTGFAVIFLGTVLMDNVLYLNIMVHTLNY